MRDRKKRKERRGERMGVAKSAREKKHVSEVSKGGMAN